MKNYFLAISLFSVLFACGQDKKVMVPDSLSKRDYSFFNEKYRLEMDEKDLLEVYTSAHLAKSKSEANYREMVNAYKSRLHCSAKYLQVVYADSMIYAALKSKEPDVLGSAYLTKGMVLYSLKNYAVALDNYILANNLIANTEDEYLKYKVKYNIALIKYYLGYYDEAVQILKDCLEYFVTESENENAYLQSLHFLGLCYNKIGDYDLSSSTNKFAQAEQHRLQNIEFNYYFLHSEAINQYFRKKYNLSISNLERSLPDIIRRKDFANESVAYFYIAKSYLAMGQREKALPFLYKVDSIYREHNYLRPDLRETYELLIKFYKSEKNLEMELVYINRLLKADEMLHGNFKYLVGKIFKEYDTGKLLKEKKDIERTLSERNVIDIIMGIGLAGLLLVVIFIWKKYRKTQQLYRSNFDLLMQERKLVGKPLEIEIGLNQPLDINPDIINGVLKRLEKFESNKKYLDKDLTLVKMASILNSNTNYVSKIIYHYKAKKYLEYVRDLRIDYIIDLLETESRYRKYSQKALAEEAGFLTSKNLSKAFLKKMGISLDFFIKALNETSSSTAIEPFL